MLLGNTLYPTTHDGEFFGQGDDDSCYIEGSDFPYENDDSSSIFREEKSEWDYFKNQLGTMFGYIAQRKKDCFGNNVSHDFMRITRLQDIGTRDEWHKIEKFIEVSAPLRGYFDDGILVNAMKLFKIVRPRLLGDRKEDIALILACIDCLLRERLSYIKEKVVKQIREGLDLDITKQDIFKYRMKVKKAYIQIKGREYALSEIHNRAVDIVKGGISEELINLDVDLAIRYEIKRIAYMIIDELNQKKYGFTPKDYENQVLGAIKIAMEEVGLATDIATWACILGLDEDLKQKGYYASYKMKKKIEDWSFLSYEEIITDGVQSEPESEVVTAEQVNLIIKAETGSEILAAPVINEFAEIDFDDNQPDSTYPAVLSLTANRLKWLDPCRYNRKIMDILVLNLLIYVLQLLLGRNTNYEENISELESVQRIRDLFTIRNTDRSNLSRFGKSVETKQDHINFPDLSLIAAG